MLAIPATLQIRFEESLRKMPVPNHLHGYYKKWLRYYLDFCIKYNLPPREKESLPHFLRKLKDKNQTKAQQEQAVKAISLFYQIVTSIPQKEPAPRATNPRSRTPIEHLRKYPIREAAEKFVRYEKVIPPTRPEPAFSPSTQNTLHTPQPAEKIDAKWKKGASWVAQLSTLEEEIRVRHYSPKTLKTYRGWVGGCPRIGIFQ